MRLLFTLIVIVILAGAGYYFYAQSVPATGMQDTSMNMDTDRDANMDPMPMDSTGTSPDVNIGADGSVSTGEVHEITVANQGMTFNPKNLTVNKGERVRITFNNTGGTHDFRVEGYDVGTEVISGGESETFEFVADEAGDFEFYCSVGNHRALGMKGTLTVEE